MKRSTRLFAALPPENTTMPLRVDASGVLVPLLLLLLIGPRESAERLSARCQPFGAKSWVSDAIASWEICIDCKSLFKRVLGHLYMSVFSLDTWHEDESDAARYGLGIPAGRSLFICTMPLAATTFMNLQSSAIGE